MATRAPAPPRRPRPIPPPGQTLPLDQLFEHSDRVNRKTPRQPRPTSLSDKPDNSAAAPAAVDDAGDDEHQGDDDAGDGKPRGGGRPFYAVEGAGGLLALIAYPLLVNLLQGGPAQMWGWVRAKWINEPYAGPASGSSAGPTVQSAAADQGVGTVLAPGRRPTPNLATQLGLTSG